MPKKVTEHGSNNKFKKQLLLIIILILALILIKPTFAIEKVISNSADWKDVYSSMLYASLTDRYPGLFLTSSKHGTILLYSVPKSTNGTLVVSSRSQPYIINYRATMESQGYKDVQEIVSNTINLELAKRIVTEKNIKKFVIVDDAYGYNALSVASYAVLDHYYVLFANERNIGVIDTFLTDTKPEKIIIFGQVDEAVKTRLTKYNPETINLGDRFDNNIEMVKRYQDIKHSKQTLMSNGEFIEASIMSGQDPVLFIGKTNVPQQVQDYIKQSEFQVAVLIGNELINSATAIRRQIGISVFVKFAQVARNPEGAIASVEDLDKFPMPTYVLSMTLLEPIVYNTATKSLWVTYRNAAGLGAYLKGTITLVVDGQTRGVVGDQDLVFIDKNQQKTIIYDLNDISLEGNNITANVYTLFGEGKKSLENVLSGTVSVSTVQILDNAIINITDVSYDKNNNKFLIKIKNIGTVDSYVNVEITDLYVNGEYIIVSSPTVLLKPNQEMTVPIDVKLSDSDITSNPIIKVKAYYGERENSLIKILYGEYAFKLVSFDIVFYVLIVLIILLLLLVIFGRKKCPNCGAKNFRLRKNCKKCGHHLHKKIQHMNTQ